jgi:hypothetical protein
MQAVELEDEEGFVAIPLGLAFEDLNSYPSRTPKA